MARQHAAAKAKQAEPVRVLCGMTEQDDFEFAHAVLKIRWEECTDSHRGNIANKNMDTRPKLPITKDHLVKNLVSKMNTFAKISNNFPMADAITTEDQMAAYINDTEKLTKSLET